MIKKSVQQPSPTEESQLQREISNYQAGSSEKDTIFFVPFKFVFLLNLYYNISFQIYL